MKYVMLVLSGMVLLLSHPGSAGAQTPVPDLSSHEQARQWLERNPGSPQLGSVLLRAMGSAPTVDAAEELVARHLDQLGNQSERASILMQLGMILELANRYGEARTAYARALEAAPTLWTAALRHAALAVEQGDLSEGILILTRAINQAPGREVQRRAAVLRARAHALGGEVERARSHLTDLVGFDGAGSPLPPPDLVEDEALFLFHEVAGRSGATAARDWAEAALRARGRFLPESMLAGAAGPEADFYPTPSRVLGGFVDSVALPTRTAEREPPGAGETPSARDRTPEPGPETAVTAIQTGSFRDPENARYMAEDIRAIGYEATVEVAETDNGSFYRVLVPLPTGSTPEDAQRQIVELKERGIEGFLVF